MRRALAVAVLTLIAATSAQAQRDRTVNIYNWSDYVDPTVIEAFSKETGIAVKYDTFDANETLETKLLAGRSGYDVVAPTAYFLQRQISAGVLSATPALVCHCRRTTRRRRRAEGSGGAKRACALVAGGPLPASDGHSVGAGPL